MKHNLTTRATLGGTGKMLRGLMGSNASGGHCNSELDKLRAQNARLLAALQRIAYIGEGTTPDEMRTIARAEIAKATQS